MKKRKKIVSMERERERESAVDVCLNLRFRSLVKGHVAYAWRM